MDDPNRITKSKAAGALFGLTPRRCQSGEKDVTSGITRAGNEMVRTALYEGANVLLSRITQYSKLKRWGIDVAKRRGSKRAKVALARLGDATWVGFSVARRSRSSRHLVYVSLPAKVAARSLTSRRGPRAKGSGANSFDPDFFRRSQR